MTTISNLHYRTLKKSETSLKEYVNIKDKINLERIKENINKNHSNIKSKLKVSTNEKATNVL